MRRTLALASLLVASSSSAGPIGAGDPQAAQATGFPRAFLGTASLSLSGNPEYGGNLLDALAAHLKALAIMTSPREVAAYLEQSAIGGGELEDLRAALGPRALDAPKAAALLLADALARPDQFREILDGLERLQRGLGRRAASILRGVKGSGSPRLLEALRNAGARKPHPTLPIYGHDGRLDLLFDGNSIEGRDGVVLDVPAEGAVVRPQRSDRAQPARP